MPVNCDSVILLYRPNTKTDWKEFQAYSKTVYSIQYGFMALDSFPNGQYTFANGVSHVLLINEVTTSKGYIKIYPNPSSGSFTVDVPPVNNVQYLYVYTIEGKMIAQLQVSPGQNSCKFNNSSWKNGTYLISLWNGQKKIDSGNLIISH
jgi:hypothetical protein